MNDTDYACPWCSKAFASPAGRWRHAKMAHPGADLDRVSFTIIDGEQIPNTDTFQPIGDVVAKIAARVEEPK